MRLHNNHKLHSESEEEEKVEFEQGNVDLKGQISSLHSQVGRDMLVNGPRKFVVELPGTNGKQRGADGQDTGYGNEKWLRLAPNGKINIPSCGQLKDGLLLHGAVDEQTDII